jgi:hypothetical protein
LFNVLALGRFGLGVGFVGIVLGYRLVPRVGLLDLRLGLDLRLDLRLGLELRLDPRGGLDLWDRLERGALVRALGTSPDTLD